MRADAVGERARGDEMPVGSSTPRAGTVASNGIERAATASVGDGAARRLDRERWVDIQRARILAAMAQVSAERGAANATVARVVEHAGVSRRTFYELFGDREDCFLAAFDVAVAHAGGYMLDACDPAAGWAERIRGALVGLLRFLDAEPNMGRLLIVGSLGAGTRALERRGRVLARLVAAVDAGRAEARAGSELPELTADGVVGGVLAVLHSRLLASPLPAGGRGVDDRDGSLLELAPQLMSAIVLPYLGPAAARRECKRPAPAPTGRREPSPADPLRDVRMRLTYRTVRVLTAVGAHPGSSNRAIGAAADMHDQGQISKLLTRLAGLGLIENGTLLARGSPNAWSLTERGTAIARAIGEHAGAVRPG
jgi:AcrR family transcriptional regulator/DNA-binding MarR family transcriptional regulator